MLADDERVLPGCGSALFRVPKSGAPAGKQEITRGLHCFGDIAATPRWLWVVGAPGGELRRIAKPGPTPAAGSGSASVAVADTSNVTAIAVSGSAVYFSSADKIFRLDEGASRPGVVVSGLPHPASVIVIAAGVLYFADTHYERGLLEGGLYAVDLRTPGP